jgi:hypothetical protein
MSAAAGISAGASLLGGILGSNASGQAAKEEIQALQKAQASLQQDETQGKQSLAPYLGAGSQATGLLSDMLSTPGQGLLTPWTQQFTAPTAAQAAATPGYQFQLQQGENAIQNSAAARGGLLSGGTLADLNNYAQGTASTNYQNTFSNALTQYQNAYQTFLNNQNNTYNRLAGQSAQGLGAAGQNVNLITGIGGDIASLYGAQGTAAAQGTIGSANAMSGALGGIGNTFSSLGLLSQMNGGGGMASLFNPGASSPYTLGIPEATNTGPFGQPPVEQPPAPAPWGSSFSV